MEKYKTFSTTADVGISIQGIGYEGLFRNALKGLNLLYFGEKFGDWGKDILYKCAQTQEYINQDIWELIKKI